MSARLSSICAVVLVLVGLQGVAWGTAMPTTATIVVVDAENAGESGQFAALFPANALIEGTYGYELDAPVTINSAGGTQLGTLNSLGLVFNADPAVSLEFSVRAGAYGTNFTITSATISFDPISAASAVAYATAAVTVTDRNSNGATLTGLFAGNKAYQARFNGSTVWTSLLNNLSAGAGSTNNADDRTPTLPTIWQSVGYQVSMISSQFKFHLTALDSASGTSMFEVVPEPATLGLLGLGLLLVLRRR
jgi:hypothetical protein